ncbi:hypothetical protein VQ02_17615 [Methylobacterium variabile]|jgi:hypothetical protein|uniref:Uncharacterized protein n=1 Tax=Methylobacterium variabile TaxID=298794 RepID=A0A0J6SNR5_9HYPH|nr:hypothetical protein [Methylobacterium variabile]KMO35267.1 hypothetical protein VQ02_17615 [Methylobacterium variabile]
MFTTKSAQFHKIDGSLRAAAVDPDMILKAVVKVTEPGYVPPGVTVRSQIDETLLTGEATASTLPVLDSDPKIVSVSLSRPLRIID